MYRVLSPHTLVPAAWLAVLILAGCGDRDRSAAVQDTVPAGPETGMATDTAAVDTAGGNAALTDANIVALLDEANMADSAAGALAATKATNKVVKDFARLMMSEHHGLRVQGRQLAQRLKVTPEPPANDPVKPLAETETQALESTPKGPKFDRVYIDQEIAVHKAVLDLVENAHDQADNEQLKSLIEQAKPVIQKHLDQAEKIGNELGEATS
jgi:putative membrane protein